MTISNTAKTKAESIVANLLSAMADYGIPANESQIAQLTILIGIEVQQAINAELYGIADPCECGCCPDEPEITIIVTLNEGPIGPIIPGEPHWRN